MLLASILDVPINACLSVSALILSSFFFWTFFNLHPQPMLMDERMNAIA